VVKQNNVHLAILSLNIEIINFQVIGISDGVSCPKIDKLWWKYFILLENNVYIKELTD